MPSLAERAEQAVLGALLLDHNLLERVPYLAAADFAGSAHRSVFAAVNDGHLTYPATEGYRFTELVAAIVPAVDPIYLQRLPERCPRPAHLNAYARMVTEAALIRELGAHAERFKHDAAELIRHADRLRLSGAAASRSRAFPDHLAKLAQAMQQHAARLNPDQPDVVADEVHVPAGGWPSDPRAWREMEVLADLIQHPGVCEQVMDWLPGHAFTRGPRREIYEAMRAVVRSGNPVDPLTVAWQLGTQRASEGITGFGIAPGAEPDPVSASPDHVFQLARMPVERGSAIMHGGIRLAEHIRSELSPGVHPGPGDALREGPDNRRHPPRIAVPPSVDPETRSLMPPPDSLGTSPGHHGHDHEPRLK